MSRGTRALAIAAEPPLAPVQLELPAGREAIRAADLFCGAGGLSEGLRQAGFEIAMGSDHDPDACATYAANFPEAVTLLGDIRDRELREQVTAAAAGVDVIVGPKLARAPWSAIG
jgi:DNA (cytosine-5)-methyltransferase 1